VLDECIGVGSIRLVAARIRRDVPVVSVSTAFDLVPSR
jgi:hypothetical protein